MDLTTTLSGVEVFWIVAGLACLPLAVANLRQAGLNWYIQLCAGGLPQPWWLVGAVRTFRALRRLARWVTRRPPPPPPPVATALSRIAAPTLARIAWLAVRREGVITGLQALFLVVGVRSAFYPPAVGATWDANLVGALFIAAQLGLLGLSIRTAQDEAALRRDYQAQERRRRR